MFYGRMVEYPIAKPTHVDDGYGYFTDEYEQCGTSRIYIILQDRSAYKSNDLDLVSCSWVGYTQDAGIKEGYLIDGAYKVARVIPYRSSFVLYLESIENGR